MKTRSILFFAVFGLVLLGLAACSAPAPTAVAVQPTAVAAQPTATTVPPTATDTAVPPTATSLPPTATNTAVPPTATNTAVPPTKTNTPTLVPPTATATATSLPPTATKVPATATRKPTLKPTAKPTVAKAFAVNWKTDMGYEGRDADSRWCQFHNETQNLTTEDMQFQDLVALLKHPIGAFPDATTAGFQPVFGIANADGSINRWDRAGWYAKLFGWPNGIVDFPPKPVVGGASSGDWTWYSTAQNNGEFCRFVYLRWKGQLSAAEFAPDGKLINTNATLPEGAP